MKDFFKKKENLCWLGIISVTLFIHCFRIGDIPYGINVDEMGMGYDAWCLSHYGTDRYLNSFPIYLINFSGGQSALYAYLCAPFVYLFGVSAAVLRIPAVLFSFITFFFAIRITDFLWHNKKINMLTGFLYAIFPVFLLLSRIGLDCNLMLGMSAIFIYCLIKAINTGRYRDFVLAGLAGGGILYSYVLSHMLLPLFLLLLISYLLYARKINFKQTLAMGVPIFILAVPLMMMHIINMYGLEEIKLGIFTIPKLYRYRSDDLAWESIKENFIGFFKVTLLSDNLKFNSIQKYGNMYFITIPFILIGMIHGIIKTIFALKDRYWNPYAVIVLWMISAYATGILISDGGPSVYRVNSIFLPYLLFVVDGIIMLYNFLKKYSITRGRRAFHLLIGAYICFFASFINYYFCDYTKDTYLMDLFNFTFEDVLQYMEDDLLEGVADRTTYIGDGNQTYIYYLCSTMTSPYEYNTLVDDEPYTLWQWTQRYKNYEFNFPENIDPVGNYIVPETSTKYIEMFEQYGFEKEHIGTHYLFWNSMLNQNESDAEAIVSWDHGIENGNIVSDEDNNIVLSGWAINTTFGTTWDDIIAVVNGKNYVAEKMDRKDVADILQNENLLTCGFHIIIPTEEIQQDTVKVFFIDYKNRVCHIEEYSKIIL